MLKVGQDYTVDENGRLELFGDWSDGSTINNEKIKVTTFANHDQMSMRTEIFSGSTGGIVDLITDFGTVASATNATDLDFGL